MTRTPPAADEVRRDTHATTVAVVVLCCIGIAIWILPDAEAGFNFTANVTVAAGGTQSGFVYRLDLNNSTMNYSGAQPNGTDVRFYDSGGAPLDSWIYLWNSTVQGHSVVFVEIPTLTSAATYITMRYGDGALTSHATTCADFAQKSFVCDTAEVTSYAPPYSLQGRNGDPSTCDAGDATRANGYMRLTDSTSCLVRYDVRMEQGRNISRDDPSVETGALVWFGASAANWIGINLLSNNDSNWNWGINGAQVVQTPLSSTTDYGFLMECDNGEACANDGVDYVNPPYMWTVPRDLRLIYNGSGGAMEGVYYRDGIEVSRRDTDVASAGGSVAGYPTMVISAGGNDMRWDNFYVRNISDVGDRNLTVNSTTQAPAAPGAPTLVGTVVGYQSYLSWTPVGGALGYNLTRVDEYGLLRVTLFGAGTTAFTEGARTSNWTYTVTSWGAGGTSVPSNSVTLRIPPQPFFSDTGALWGSGKSALAASLGVSTTATGVLYGLFIVLLFAGLGFTFAKLWGAAGGAVAGLCIAIASGMFPVWVIVFFIVTSAAGAVLYQRSSGGGV